MVRDLQSALLRHGVPTSLLNIEITETAAVVNLRSAAEQLRTLVDAAKAMGLRTTAEGVERDAQLAILRKLGCDTAQGYLISRPLPAEELDSHANSAEPAGCATVPGI
ncbi:EAL domain-containing protein [Arthrobacter sp. UYEF3]|uniref:EAL domain-containing protein n=1 Tax=Arthrobacter sp. UYEF3 TaxID=1756365 RepID=UPI003398DAB5